MDFRDFNIEINTSKTTGEYQTTCPKCSADRKKKKDKCLSVNLDKNTWFCFHCGWKGGLINKIQEVEYVKPEWKNNTNLSEKVVKWFEDHRKISQGTLNEMKITEGLEFMPQVGKEINTIQFNYFRGDFLTNVKYRTGNKHFKLHKGSELIFYNLNALENQKEIIICEGEIDALTFIQCGFKNVVSVPNGANLNTNNLQYVDNCINLFDEVETIILATDNDIAGRKLRQDLAERFGVERCKYAEFSEYKDANELFIHKGGLGIAECLKSLKTFPLEGVFTIEDFDNEINDLYENGLDRGVKTGIYDLDEHIRFVKGYITTITGIPGHGKSDYMDQIAICLFNSNKWKFAFYSPENKPTKLHFSKMARKIVGRNWFGENRITVGELNEVKKRLNNNFWFVKPEKDFTLESILKHVKLLKKMYGIDAFVIDAWNKLEHKYGQSETKYIGESLDKLSTFCEQNNLHCFLVAHPRKMQKAKDSIMYEVPNLYDISGSSNFYNKTDNGLCIYRNYETNQTEVYIQKVKFSHWGKTGRIFHTYDLESGRFLSDDSNFGFDEPKEVISNPNLYIEPKDAFGEDYNINNEIDF